MENSLSYLLLALLLGSSTASAGRLELGISAYRSREFVRAESELRAALRLDPKSSRAHIYLARTLVEAGLIPQAIEEIRTLLKSPNPDLQLEGGRLLQDLGGRRAAELQRVAPDSAEAHFLLARSLENSGKLREGASEYRAALVKNPRMPGAHYALGNLAWRQQDFEAALQEFQQELEQNPNHTGSNLRLGEILIAQNRAADAVPFLNKAVQSDPDLLDARRQLGRALRATGQYQAALAQFRVVAQRKPDDDSVHAQLASVYRALGDESLAARELEIQRGILTRKLEASQANAGARR